MNQKDKIKVKLLIEKLEKATGKKVQLKEATDNFVSALDTLNKSDQGLGGKGYQLSYDAQGSSIRLFLNREGEENGKTVFQGSKNEARAFISGMFSAFKVSKG